MKNSSFDLPFLELLRQGGYEYYIILSDDNAAFSAMHNGKIIANPVLLKMDEFKRVQLHINKHDKIITILGNSIRDTKQERDLEKYIESIEK